MSNILERKIKSIFSNNPENFTRLEISIECPLESGVKVTGEWIGNGKNAYPQLDNAWDFLLYVKEYRKNNPDHLFNRVSIIANDSQIVDIAFSFDEVLQQQTMENIK